jgi:hypothetical protein
LRLGTDFGSGIMRLLPIGMAIIVLGIFIQKRFAKRNKNTGNKKVRK